MLVYGMPHGRDCGGGEIAVPLHPETFINYLKGYKGMKRTVLAIALVFESWTEQQRLGRGKRS